MRVGAHEDMRGRVEHARNEATSGVLVGEGRGGKFSHDLTKAREIFMVGGIRKELGRDD